MTQDYVGQKLITAWPQEKPAEVGPPDQGYAVKYEDGYTSWSPRAVFEAAYKPLTALDFSGAIFMLKRGKKVARAGWNGKGMWIVLHPAAVGEVVTHPYLCIEYPAGHLAYPDGSCIPWLASQTDLLAEDWQVVE